MTTDDLIFDQQMEQARQAHVASLVFRRGDRVAAARRLTGSYWDECGDALVRYDVPQGAEGLVTTVRQYVTPYPYVIRFDDGTQLSAAQNSLARVS